VAHRKTLNETQLAVLKWVADGCPDGVMDDYAHRISAAALHRRGLVRTAGRGTAWRAEVTRAGRDYLARAEGPDAPRPRQPNTSVTQQLVDQVTAAGGSLRVAHRPYYSREGVNYALRARLAERYGKVPDGKRLAVSAVGADELQIDMVDAAGGVAALEPVPVPARVARYHPLVRRFKQQQERHEVSRAALPRALRMLQALVVEAERRGYGVSLAEQAPSRYGLDGWSGPRDGHLQFTVEGTAEAIRISEEGLKSRAYWERQAGYATYRNGGRSGRPRLSEYEQGATGRLRLEIVGYSGAGRQVKWADRKAGTVEQRLPEVLRELEIRASERAERRREAERREVEQKRRWSNALDDARAQYLEHRRSEALTDQVRRFEAAQAIRTYCDAAEAAYPNDQPTAEWASWARRYASDLDPLSGPPGPPPEPESVPPEELRPFLDGWDPYTATRRHW
jgi:hypothetical protein